MLGYGYPRGLEARMKGEGGEKESVGTKEEEQMPLLQSTDAFSYQPE